MRGQRDVLAPIPQEFALAAAETSRLEARRDQHAKILLSTIQRRGDERMQSALASRFKKKGNSTG